MGADLAVCPVLSSLVAIDGANTGSGYEPVGLTCIDADAVCRTVRITFRVPAGVYSMYNLVRSIFDDRHNWLTADDPEFRVGSDTTMRLDLDAATKVTIHAPDPTESMGEGVMESVRAFGDLESTNGLIAAPYTNTYWAVPTQPVSIGAYFFKTTWILGRPAIVMSVTGGSKVALNPVYPSPGPGPWHFTGRQSLAVVDGGFGNADDLANVDVHGKLVLIRNEAGGDRGCLVWRDKLQSALDAGAAGVLVDPAQPFDINGEGCQLPMYPSYDFPGFGDPVAMPFAALPFHEAQQLRDLVARGPVTITATDGGETPYEYDVTFVDNAQVPASETHTVTSKELASVDARFHSAQPAGLFSYSYSNWTGIETLTGGVDVPEPRHPFSRRIYLGPISPEMIWARNVSVSTPAPDFNLLAAQEKDAVYNRAGPGGAEDWNDQPGPPGIPIVSTALHTAQPGRFDSFAVCAGCRQGNVFVPWMYLTSADPQIIGFDLESFWAAADPNRVHLFRDGQELQSVDNPFGAAAYRLPPDTGRYHLTVDEDNSQTAWDFTDSVPTADATPPGYACVPAALGLDSGPCRADPLIFLRYDAGATLDNTVSAPGAHRVKISVSRLDPDAPAITALTVWTSTDGGATWTPAPSAAHGDGTYVADYSVAQVSATDGAVSFRVQAQDAAGNDVVQTVKDAVRLVPGKQ
jgi:hypothetical protein